MNKINVFSVEKFVDNINSDTHITLGKNIYNVSNLLLKASKNVYYENVFDGSQLVIENMDNICIIGEKNISTEILTEPRYANVITFKKCKNVSIENLTLGHTKENGSCIGGVLRFDDCENISIKNSILFGCGTEGITLHNVNTFNMEESVIKECSEGIMSIYSSNDIKFLNCDFFGNSCYHSMRLDEYSKISCLNCNIYNNINTNLGDCKIFEFNDANTIMDNCNIHDNYDN